MGSPMGEPFEQRFLPKKRRLLSSYPSPTGDTIVAPSASTDMESSTSTTHQSESQPGELTDVLPGLILSPAASTVEPPSPALFVEQCSFSDEDVSFAFQYGSEEDSISDESDGEDLRVLSIIPRQIGQFFNNDDEEPQPDSGTCALLVWDTMLTLLQPQPSSSPLSLTYNNQPPSTYEPVNMFDFQWRTPPNPQISPNLRRESFSDISCGPTTLHADPYAAFTAIWDREIVEHICIETNRYAQQHANELLLSGRLCPQSRITRWQDITSDELYTYFAVLIAMGVVVKSRVKDYWSNTQNIFITPGFSAQISYRRFCLISRCLHFNNNENLPSSLTRAQAKIWKVQPVVDHLNEKFSMLYNLSRNIVLSESLTQWKSWLGMNQFIPNKQAAVDIKTYEICEYQSGYLWRFEVHSDSEPSQESGPVSGTIPSIVPKMLRGLEYKGHTVWMDSNFNSPALARTLKSMNFDCAGRVRTSRQFFPARLATLMKSEIRKGQIAICTSGDVDLIVWRDKIRVALISTYHGCTSTSTGNGLKPTVLADYNVCMAGVDKKDHVLSVYPIERPKVWYKWFFRRLLNVSMLNAYILYSHNHPTSHHDFRIDVVRQLLHHHRQQPKTILAPSLKGRPIFSADFLQHMPQEIGLLPGGGKLRRKCEVCKERTHTYCPGCNVLLCVLRRGDSSSTFTCFRTYHT